MVAERTAGPRRVVPTPSRRPRTAVRLPVCQRVRRVADVQFRTPHKTLPDGLLRCVARWTDVPAGRFALLPPVTAAEQGEGTVAAAERGEGEGEPAAGVDLRGLLIVRPKVPSHPTQFEIVAANLSLPAGKPRLEAYGGPASATDAAAELSQLVREQCGVDVPAAGWVPLVELEYRDGRRVLFHFASGLGASVQLRPQVREVAAEREVEKEVTDDEADGEALERWLAEEEERVAAQTRLQEEAEALAALHGTDPPPAPEVHERQRVTKTVRVVEQVVTKVPQRQPMRVPFRSLLEQRLPASAHQHTIEMTLAADALDEMLQREAGAELGSFLRRVATSRREFESVRKRWQERAEGRKRKREEEDAARKKARAEREAEIRASWRREDEGRTDDEKRASFRERRQLMAGLWCDEDASIRERRQREAKADAEAAAAALRSTSATDHAALTAFQFLDPEQSQVVSRQSLEDLLCAVEPDRAAGDVREMMRAALPGEGQTVAYRQLCVVHRRPDSASGTCEELN